MRFDGVSRHILPTQWGKPCGVHHFFYVSVQKWETSPLIKNCVRGPRYFRYPIFRQTQIKNMWFNPMQVIFTYIYLSLGMHRSFKMREEYHSFHEMTIALPWTPRNPTARGSESPQRVSEAPDTEASFTVRWLLRSPFTVLVAWRRRRRRGSVDFMAGGFVRWDILGYIYIHMYLHMYICVYIICEYIV